LEWSSRGSGDSRTPPPNFGRLDLAPQRAGAWRNLGRAQADLGRLEQAEASWSKVTELEPQSANDQKVLGELYKRMARPEAAIAAMQKAVALDDKSADLHFELGRTFSAAESAVTKAELVAEVWSIRRWTTTRFRSIIKHMTQTAEQVVKEFRRIARRLRLEHRDPAKARAFLLRAGIAEKHKSSPGGVRLAKRYR
jgi:tetratricopeptide (TPR) repeat protein